MPERVFTVFALDDLFPVIGMTPHLGRGFTTEELAPKGPRVAIISHRLWQSQFAGGSRDHQPHGPDRRRWHDGGRGDAEGTADHRCRPVAAVGWDPAAQPRNQRAFTILARLAPGATLESANAELATIAGQVQQAEQKAFPEYDGWRLTATPWASALLRDVRPAAFILLGAVGFVLLIACANLTNLMLARATTMHRELAYGWRSAPHGGGSRGSC